MDEGVTIHGVGVAPERPSRVEGLTRALDVPDEPTIPNTPPVRAVAPQTVRMFPRGKIIALFVGGILFGLALGAIVLVT